VLQAEYSVADKKLKRVREEYRKWVDDLARKAEDAIQNNENKDLYKITRKEPNGKASQEGPMFHIETTGGDDDDDFKAL
jgi:hypothetical protein